MTQYAALVCRLSPRPDGSYEGVGLQTKWGRAYASILWPDLPVEVFADAGKSAFKDDAPRPEYERFRQWVRDGRIAQVWAVEQTRLERNEIRWFQLAAELHAAGIAEVHTDRDGIVRVLDEVAGIKAVLAAAEVRKMKRRLNDRLAESAADGLPSGGLKFGYRPGLTKEGAKTLVVVPKEAAAVRFAAEKVLAGWSRTNIARELSAQGLKGVHGGRFTATGVGAFLKSPTVAGLRVYQGEVVGQGNWEPILDEATWRAVQRKMEAPRVVTRVDGASYPVTKTKIRRTGRKYLLTSGKSICGVCKRPLAGGMRDFRGKAIPYYTCNPSNGGGGCIGIKADSLESYVAKRLFAELERRAFAGQLGVDTHEERRNEVCAQLDEVKAKRKELARQWAKPGELDADEWQEARDALSERRDALRAELDALPPPMRDVDPEAIRDGWEDIVLDERREIIDIFVEVVRVHRAKNRRKPDDDRIKIKWRGAG